MNQAVGGSNLGPPQSTIFLSFQLRERKRNPARRERIPEKSCQQESGASHVRFMVLHGTRRKGIGALRELASTEASSTEVLVLAGHALDS